MQCEEVLSPLLESDFDGFSDCIAEDEDLVKRSCGKRVKFELDESSDTRVNGVLPTSISEGKGVIKAGILKKKFDSKTILLKAFGQSERPTPSTTKKSRACILCRDTGHDKRKCPLR